MWINKNRVKLQSGYKNIKMHIEMIRWYLNNGIISFYCALKKNSYYLLDICVYVFIIILCSLDSHVFFIIYIILNLICECSGAEMFL